MTTYEENALSSMPTAEWQDRLAARLSRNISEGPRSTQLSPSRAYGEAPLTQRRRLDESSSGAGPSYPNWNKMYIMETSSGNSIISIASLTIQRNVKCFRFRRDR